MTCIWRPPLYGGHFCQVPRVAAIDRFDCIYIYIYRYVCVCMYICIYVCMYVCVYIHVYVCVVGIYVCVCVYMRARTYVQFSVKIEICDILSVEWCI